MDLIRVDAYNRLDDNMFKVIEAEKERERNAHELSEAVMDRVMRRLCWYISQHVEELGASKPNGMKRTLNGFAFLRPCYLRYSLVDRHHYEDDFMTELESGYTRYIHPSDIDSFGRHMFSDGNINSYSPLKRVTWPHYLDPEVLITGRGQIIGEGRNVFRTSGHNGIPVMDQVRFRSVLGYAAARGITPKQALYANLCGEDMYIIAQREIFRQGMV